MSTPNSPTHVLREEHQLILKVIDVLQKLLDEGERGGAFDFDKLAQCISFFRLFADACHHGKEEELLFPELEARGVPRDGGPIGVMLLEHQQGRAFVRQMNEALEPARGGDGEALGRLLAGGRGYIDLLRNHIDKEDNVLFMVADRMVDEAACQKLCGDYAHVCSGQFEGRTKQQLHAMAQDLCAGG